jgi:branched-chain amino acid transport system permease protein
VNDFFRYLVAGVSLGSVYALVSVGFVTIQGDGVVNFAQGGFVMLGAYVAATLRMTLGLPFPIAIMGAMVAMRCSVPSSSACPAPARRQTRLLGDDGLPRAAHPARARFRRPSGDTTGRARRPVGDRYLALGAIAVKVADLWTIGAAGSVLVALWAFFTFSVRGVAMRAAAADPEAALANGIGAGAVYGVAWAIAGAIAALAGILLASGSKGVDLTIGAIALRAFPAMILGGLDSPNGAVAGGIIIGLTEVLAAAYLTPNAPWLGNNVHVVAPYAVMLLVLLVRPYGIAGTPEIRRV